MIRMLFLSFSSLCRVAVLFSFCWYSYLVFILRYPVIFKYSKKEFSSLAGGSAKKYSYFQRQFSSFLKNKTYSYRVQ